MRGGNGLWMLALLHCERALVSYVDKYSRIAGRKLSGLKVLLMPEKERMKA